MNTNELAQRTSPPRASAVRPRIGNTTLYRSARAVAVVAALFCLMVSGTLVVQRFHAGASSTWKSPELEALKQKLRASPKDEALQGRIRRLDLDLRQRYFRRLSLTGAGSYLLLCGAMVLVVAAKRAAHCRKSLPMPKPKPEVSDANARASAVMRWSVAATAAVIAGGFGILTVATPTNLSSGWSEIEKLLGHSAIGDEASARQEPTPEELRANWPRFRGADGNGVTSQTNLPLAWNAKTGERILWKAALPLPGFSSPIVWRNRVFLSSGDENRRAVFCFDADKGELLWDRTIEAPAGAATTLPESPLQSGFAAATMATDGLRIFAIFGTGDLVALDFEGKIAWSKSLGLPKNTYGHASSLVVWRGSVLLQLDQGESEERKSRLYAFDVATGRVLWQRQRPVSSSWATPIVISAAEKAEVITLGVPWLIAYAANDGTELWRAECLNGEITPSPVFAGGLVLAVSPSEKLLAIRPDGQGDVTKTHVAWTAEENVPDIASPVSNGELVFTLATSGVLSCYEVKDGKKLWEHDFNAEFQASPSLAGDRLYLAGLKGSVMVVAAGRQFKELARSEMGEDIVACPAFANDRIYLRTAKNLYCVGEPGAQMPTSASSHVSGSTRASRVSVGASPTGAVIAHRAVCCGLGAQNCGEAPHAAREARAVPQKRGETKPWKTST